MESADPHDRRATRHQPDARVRHRVPATAARDRSPPAREGSRTRTAQHRRAGAGAGPPASTPIYPPSRPTRRNRNGDTVMPRQILPALVAIATAAALLAGCGGSTASPPSPGSAPPKPASAASGDAVTIRNFKFAPASLTVKSGAKIAVTND